MNLFKYRSYKEFLRDRLGAPAGKTRGQLSRLAEHLDVQPSMLSQVLRADKHLSLEQSHKVCSYFGFDEQQTAYFLDLVLYERAGTVELQQHYRKRLDQGVRGAKRLSSSLKKDPEMHDSEKAKYYSNWYYSAVRLLTEIPEFQVASTIAKRLGLPHALVSRVLAFLLSTGLCIESGRKVKIGPTVVYAGANNDWVNQHHRNWRLKGMERIGDIDPREVLFTLPASVSRKSAEEIRELLRETLRTVLEKVREPGAEDLYCLTVDWFNVGD
jgi:uncharacterized protein (TIGR02147 family)